MPTNVNHALSPFSVRHQAIVAGEGVCAFLGELPLLAGQAARADA